MSAGRAVVPIDVDLQDPPEAIGAMLAKWREGYDIVYGVRDNRESDSLPKRLTADLYYRAHNWLSDDKIPEHAGDFRLLDRKVVDVIRAMPERNRFMKGLFAWAGFRQAAVALSPAPRAGRHDQIPLLEAVDAWRSTGSLRRRRCHCASGAISAVSSHWCALGLRRLHHRPHVLSGIDVPGYASMMVAVLFLGGLQLLSLGVLGEYVGRILIETKGRPLYVIRETIGGGLMGLDPRLGQGDVEFQRRLYTDPNPTRRGLHRDAATGC